MPVPSLVGVESCGNSQWFLELLEQLGHEVWVGDAAQIRASYVRKQKTDRRDAAHLLKLLLEGRFPRLWRPDAEVRDLRQLLIHRHRRAQIRTRVKNGLQHLAMNRGMQKKNKLWSAAGQRAFLQLPLPGWGRCRREDLLALLAKLDEQIRPLEAAVEKAAFAHPQARPYRWVVERGVPPELSSESCSRVFVLTTQLWRLLQRGSHTARENLALDNAFVLIDGVPVRLHGLSCLCSPPPGKRLRYAPSGLPKVQQAGLTRPCWSTEAKVSPRTPFRLCKRRPRRPISAIQRLVPNTRWSSPGT